MLLSLAYWLLVVCGLGLLWIGFNPVARYRYRHIPGPFALPFIGHLVPIGTIYIHIWCEQLRKRYGPIFKIWYGTTPWVVICEPEAIRKVAYKCQNRFMLTNSLLGEPLAVYENNLLLAHSDVWRNLKKAWDPAMLHTSSLQGYTPLLQACAERLAEGLAPAERSGEPVDIKQAISDLTLEAVGECAFGIKFSAQEQGEDDAWAETGRQLRAGTIKFFASQETSRLSVWAALTVILPPLTPLLKRLAYLLPDQGHIEANEGEWQLIRGSTQILEASRQQRLAGQAQATAAAPAAANGKPEEGVSKAPRGVRPGSFVAQLELWKAKHGGEKDVSDGMLVAQIITFVTGGYETTATAFSMLMYRLSINPEAQRKVQQELDDVLGGRPPAFEDLPKLVYLDACIKEALRMNDPGALLIRSNDLQQRLDVLGYTMPRGAKMLLFNHGVQTDVTYWERADEFLPERFLPEAAGKLGPTTEHAYLPFGAGARKCVGYKFAEVEVALGAAALLTRYSFTRPEGEPPLRTKTALTTGPIGGVMVHVHARGKQP